MTPDGTTLRLLLADDDAEDRLLLQETLEAAPGRRFRVDAVEDFDAAARSLQAAAHDVCLVAQHLGAHRGAALLDLATSLPASPAVIMLLDAGDPVLEREMLRRGAADCFVKGELDAATLGRGIAAAVARRQLGSEGVGERDRLRRLLRAQVEQVRALSRREAQLLALLRDSADAWLVVSDDQRVRFLNAAALQLCRPEPTLGEPLPAALAMALMPALQAGAHAVGAVRLPDAQGRERALELRRSATEWDGRPAWLLALRDVLPERAAPAGAPHDLALRPGDAAGSVVRQATHDPLTGLPNRSLLLARMQDALASARDQGHKLALLVVDLDHFKEVNDALGHAVGDAMLQEVAGRLRGCVPEAACVARLGDDEFGVLLGPLAHPDDTLPTLQTLLARLGAPYELQGQALHGSSSIGVAVVGADEVGDPLQWLRQADLAMYAAKRAGRNTSQCYGPELVQRLNERIDMRQRLQEAIRGAEFELHYQPQIDLTSGRVRAIEALVRWQHPRLGQIGPMRFVRVAEETGQIDAIGAWVLARACAQHQQWLSQGLVDAVVAVNVSALQFQRPDFVALVEGVLAASGLPAHRLELELTESVLMDTVGRGTEVLAQLRQRGVRIAIDDFGTGFSSLGYLKRFPVDKVKIDRSFVADLGQEGEGAAIARSVIAIARHLDVRVVAEGVETEAQLDWLRRHGCDEAQGYLLAKPMSAAELTEHLRDTLARPDALRTRPTLLLVHAEASVLRALERVLQRDDLTVLGAADAATALTMLAQHRVDLVLADQHLTDRSGVELLEQVGRDFAPVVRGLLHREADAAVAERALAAGLCEHRLLVPWQDDSLRWQVRQALRSASAQDVAADTKGGRGPHRLA
ncbi:EAL domain-containing protein [Caldimonas brevitalea]|uniref:Diguanylate cyclase n=1 Tax=Caldimonas brevitalea TaxID=413882 RepID=A0A0G3BV04_9BURK|nr:EAL domain-containing protein [Caldimonas brevitalea]AKJ30340.1 diguanylate cyclase [Caldimonas brevitalea]